jgi:cell division protein FtsL
VATDAATLFRPRRLAWALGLAAVGLFVFSSAQAAYRLYQLTREVAELEHQRRALLAENRRLREEVRRLYDPAYVERLAREQLGLVRPGEVAVVLVPSPTPTPQPRRR